MNVKKVERLTGWVRPRPEVLPVYGGHALILRLNIYKTLKGKKREIFALFQTFLIIRSEVTMRKTLQKVILRCVILRLRLAQFFHIKGVLCPHNIVPKKSSEIRILLLETFRFYKAPGTIRFNNKSTHFHTNLGFLETKICATVALVDKGKNDPQAAQCTT
jgi:hypothetical protein